jgi:hypothetical protein
LLDPTLNRSPFEDISDAFSVSLRVFRGLNLILAHHRDMDRSD